MYASCRVRTGQAGQGHQDGAREERRHSKMARRCDVMPGTDATPLRGAGCRRLRCPGFTSVPISQERPGEPRPLPRLGRQNWIQGIMATWVRRTRWLLPPVRARGSDTAQFQMGCLLLLQRMKPYPRARGCAKPALGLSLVWMKWASRARSPACALSHAHGSRAHGARALPWLPTADLTWSCLWTVYQCNVV